VNLHWLKIKNFRQFYGESPKIEFASGKNNVTVIHGYNGSGKTAILNAFTWALFGEFSSGFQHTDHLVNKRAIREAAIDQIVEASVKIKFEHVGKLYVLEKKYQVTRSNSSSAISKLKTIGPQMQWSDTDGIWKEVRTPAEVIGRILPKDLHFYFFFDGERIEKFFSPSKKEKSATSNALKQFLGIEPLERAEKHLLSIVKHFQDELRKIGDSETKQILEKISNSEKKLHRQNREIENIQDNIEAEKKQKLKIEESLRDKKETAELQNKRDTFTLEKDSIIKEKDFLKKKLASQISCKAYTIFLSKPIQKYMELEKTLRKAGELPAGIKKQFVRDLLKQKKCICGTELHQNSIHRKKLEEWLERAGLAVVEERLLKLGGRVSILGTTQVHDFYKDVNDSLDRQAKYRARLSDIENELDTIHKKLGKSPEIEIRSIEARQKQAERNISDYQIQLGGIRRDIERNISETNGFNKELEKRKEKKYESDLAKRRMQVARDAQSILKEMRLSMELTNIREIDNKLKNRFKSMAPHLPYIPTLTENLSIELYEEAGGESLPVAPSQGESQLISFAFLATIIENAREWQKKQDSIQFLDSSKYPIVMDSPFGSLDPFYRTQVSGHLPNLADQVILLVTLTQWRGEVEENLSSKIGKQYVLQYHSPEKNIPDEVINIGDKSYPLISKSSNKYEYTEIVEVENG